MVGSDYGNWNCPRIMKFFFGNCLMIVLRHCSLYLCVCGLFSVWVLRKCVKIISLEFLDMVFDWLWWSFLLLWNKNDPVMRFSFIRFWENKGKKINFNLEILDFILINLEGIKLFGFVVIKFWYLPDMVLYLVSCLDYSFLWFSWYWSVSNGFVEKLAICRV